MASAEKRRMAAILSEAISAEEAAYELYEKALGLVKDEAARAVLKELRDEELLHKQMLESLDEGSWNLLPEEPGNQEVTFSDFLVGGELQERADLQDILLFAVKKEKGARDFYARLSVMAAAEKEKEFFLKLSHMEEKHRRKCEALYWETYGG